MTFAPITKNPLGTRNRRLNSACCGWATDANVMFGSTSAYFKTRGAREQISRRGLRAGRGAFPAMAADMPLKAPPPPPAPVFTWTGCYLGGSVGGIWRQTDNVRIGVVDGGSGAGAAVAAGAIPTAFGVGGSSWHRRRPSRLQLPGRELGAWHRDRLPAPSLMAARPSPPTCRRSSRSPRRSPRT